MGRTLITRPRVREARPTIGLLLCNRRFISVVRNLQLSYYSQGLNTVKIMISRQQTLKTLQRFKTENGSEYGIVSLGVFGSLARDEANEKSDVDVVIETKGADLFQLVHLKEQLETLLNAHVDIVRKRQNMNPFLIKRIERDVVYV
jgi:predicted nucleotidyltransferase